MAAPPAHQAVDRALRVIEILGAHPRGATLDELARATGVPKPSLHRTLAAMRPRNFATQLEPGGPYFLGPAALEAAFRFHAGLDVRQLLHPLAASIRDELAQTCHVAVLAGGHVTYLDKVEADLGIRITSFVGGRNPAYATGVGKALLAALLPDLAATRAWVERYGPLVARTPTTATTAEELSARLDQVRADGYALDEEESEPNLVCVAAVAALPGPVPTPTTAVSVTGLADQMRALGLAAVGQRLLKLIESYALTAPGGSTGSRTTPASTTARPTEGEAR